MSSERHGESGFEIEAGVRRRPAGRPGRAARRAGRVPVHPRRLPDDVHDPAVDDAPVRRLRHRGRVQRPLPRPARGGHDRAVASRSTCRPRWATTPTRPMAHGEVGKVGVAIDSIDDMRLLFDGIPLDKVSTSMTINAPAAVLLLLYQLVAEEQGVPGVGAATARSRTTSSRSTSPAGTYIFPPKPSLRLVADTFAYCRSEMPQMEHDLHLRLPHGRGGRHARAGDGVHAGQRRRVRAGGARRRAGRGRLRAAAVVLLRRPHHAAGGGGEVPRGPPDLGPADARRVRRPGPALA